MTGKRLFNLKDLTQDISERPGWSVVFGATCAEAAAVCLVDQGHDSPVNLRIDGVNSCEIAVSWPELAESAVRFNADHEVTTEYGAYGIAALIMPYLTGLTVIERSVKGKGLGFDFWLGSTADGEQLFQRKARLEVSGIRHGSDSQLRSRVRIKLKQIKPSDQLALGYVCVVEFATPQVRIVEQCRTM